MIKPKKIVSALALTSALAGGGVLAAGFASDRAAGATGVEASHVQTVAWGFPLGRLLRWGVDGQHRRIPTQCAFYAYVCGDGELA